jgi:hypothetical protein
VESQIKTGFCVAYDWELLKFSLPLVYSQSDKICISIDKHRVSWSGKKFIFNDETFYGWINSMDRQKKICILEEDFYLAELTPSKNEVRQRNRVAEVLGEGGWHVQLDCDEYFLDFELFVFYLKSLPKRRIEKSNVCCALITIFRQTNEGFLIVNPEFKHNMEYIQVATMEPNYAYGRRNGNFNLYTNFKLLHQSWARTEDEILNKISNWGHSKDFDSDQYFLFWKSLNEENYHTVRNFHYLTPSIWPSLQFVKGKEISALTRQPLAFPKFTKLDLFFKNSLFFSRLRTVMKWLNFRNAG